MSCHDSQSSQLTLLKALLLSVCCDGVYFAMVRVCPVGLRPDEVCAVEETPGVETLGM